ncbi:MAG: AsmA family protein [Gallionella sp.]
MNKYLKYSLLGSGAMLGVALAGAAYLAATFNPNDYKVQIVQMVKDSKQRTLHLDGDIKLTFFPSIGANLGRLSLSEYNSDRQFAAVETARVSLALMPLLSKKIVVNEVLVSGLSATLIKHKDGTTNIDDLLGNDQKPKDASQPVNFDIASVSIEKTNLSYLDEGSGSLYAIKELNLKTGRIANGVPCKVNLSAGVQANEPMLDVKTQFASTLSFDLDRKFYQLKNMDFRVTGSALDIAGLNVKAIGDVSANLAKGEYVASKFEFNVKGIRAKAPFEAVLDAPDLSLSSSSVSGKNLVLSAKFDSGNVITALSIPELSGNAQSFKVANLALDMSLQMPDQAFKIKLASMLSGNLDARQFNLSNLKLAVNALSDKLPGKEVNSEMKGSVQVDASKQVVQANLAGGLLQSQVVAKVSVNGFSNPAIQFDVDVDRFDADPYLPKKTDVKTNQPEQPLDLSALRKLNLDGSLHIGQLKVANIRSSGVRLDVKAHNGQVNVNPLSANLYQGSVKGSLSVNAQAMPEISINQALTGINVAALTKDAANFDTLEGRGNVAMNLTMQGNTVSSMKKAMGGNLSLNLNDGAIKGINIAKKLRDAQGMLGKTQTQSANQTEKTDFSELKASFKVADGVAHNDDLSMKSPFLRMSGAGDINIGNDSMNYLAKATLARTLEGQGGRDNVGGITVPVRVSGPFADLKYTLDFGAMVNELAKQKVEAKKEEIKSKVQDRLQNSLKGLFR